MKGKLAFIISVSVFTLTVCSVVAAANTNYTYTTDDDFNKGNSTGLNVFDNQLQLSNNSSSSAYSFIWVPNSNDGTVSKVNTITGLEVARYKVSPSTGASSSRTTVDLNGSCWVGNRGTGTVVKIGLFENNGYFNRNSNSTIETSRDLDGNGIITGDNELLVWGADECVLWEVVLIPGKEGTYRPGEYAGGYSGVSIPRAVAVDSQNNIWAGTYGTQKYYHINGTTGQIIKIIDVSSVGHTPYGAVIDQYGILWSASLYGNHVLRLNTSDYSFSKVNLPQMTYGLALDRNNHLFVTANRNVFSRINILNGTVDWTKWTYDNTWPKGVVVTDDGDVWTADAYNGWSRGRTVTSYSNEGVFKAQIIVGNEPTGISVDNQGKIWVVDNADEYIHRINPNKVDSGDIQNGVEISKRIINSVHYGYSDMTGVISNTITTKKGTWTIIHDSQINNALWGVVSWNSLEPDGTKITVRARSSNDKQNWSIWEEAVNGEFLKATPQGRYLEMETLFERFKGNISPGLYDLTIRALSADVNLMTILDNPTPKLGDTIKFTTIIRNNGPDAATNVKVYPVIPSGFTSVTPSKGTYSDGIWTIGSLQPDEIALFEVKGLITQELTSQNINYSVTENHSEYDPTANSVSSTSVYVPVSNVELKYDLKNGKSTLIVSNSGPDHAFNVAVKATMPSGFIPEASGGSYKDGLWFIGALSPNGAVTLTLTPVISGNGNQQPYVKVGDYKKVSGERKIVKKKNYYIQRGSIPPPGKSRRTVPMQDTGMPLNFSGIAILLIFFGAYLNKNNDKIKPNKWLALFIILFFALLFIGNVSAADMNQTYTSTDDFNKGVYNNLNGSGDKLELQNSSNHVHDYIWIPNTNQGTISKVDVKTGKEVARYRTYPDPNPDKSAPFRTVVDSQGNCWVSNKNMGSIVKIGLLENGGYVDRNNNGKIETSRDLDNNGIIMDDNELLAWGADECVLWDVILINGNEGTYRPSDYKGIWQASNNPYINVLAVDKENNVWAGTANSRKLYYIEGNTGNILKKVDMGAVNHTPSVLVIDKNGILWSGGNNLLRMDSSTGSMTVTDTGFNIFGMAVDKDDHMFLYGTRGPWYAVKSKLSRLNILNGTLEWTKDVPYCTEGYLVVTDDGDVWISKFIHDWWNFIQCVARYSHDGNLKADIPVTRPSGISVDSSGKIWVIEAQGEYIHRIDPVINGIDLSKMLAYTNHESACGMTAPSSNTYSRGTWTIIHDSKIDNAYWGLISWNSYEPRGTKVTVRARSSNDKLNWSTWEEASNGLNLKLTPRGRYLEIEIALEKFNSTQSPVVYDITIKNLDSNVLATDLGVSITGDKNTLNLGDTVKLTIKAVNNGPNSANVKVDYKIPFGLKLLSYNGPGTYDFSTGIWSIGTLPVGANATLELILQATHAGYFVNLVSVYGDLALFSTKSLSSTPKGLLGLGL